MHVLVTCKYKKDRIKSNREKVETSFSLLEVNGGLSVAMETRVLVQSVPIPYAAFPSPQSCCTYYLIKICQLADLPTCFRDIQSLKVCTRRTDDGPLVYYKLTLWAFRSGELIISKCLNQWTCFEFLQVLEMLPKLIPHILHLFTLQI